ncbi:cardiolipin synthase [Phaeovulum sp.]|uniref:cardiolipin synthase n=1 Tax=Phaeovulum sp. TaxID=2934796 RepID=UPI0039E5B464
MLYLGLHIVLMVAISLRILLRDDLGPASRMAWFIVVAMLPALGIGLYFLFGEVTLGRAATARHHAVSRRVHAGAGSALGSREAIDRMIAPEYRAAFHYAASINGFGLTTGNAAELMPDAAGARARLVADIDAATRQVDVLYYIWLDDQTGTNVAEALIRAAKRGVECRAMADSLGARAIIRSPLWQRMQDAGVKTAVALPIGNLLYTLIFSRIDLRNHRKITVIDGQISHCGSQNCADPEFRVKPAFAPWVDVMLRVTGPVVAQNQLLFASDWLLHADAAGDEDAISTSALPVADGFPALIMGDGPTERGAATPQLFSVLIQSARETLTISTPYFVPDATVLEAICATALRGVQVRIIFPQRNDSWIVSAASRSYYRKLLRAGVEIFEFCDGLLHAKTLTIDGQVSFLGSSNMDLRSFGLNYENNILLQDAATTAALLVRQADYVAASTRVVLPEVEAWPMYRRVWNNVISTIGPVL